MDRKYLLIVLFFAFIVKLNGQDTFTTESEKEIYWQPNSKIDFSDYQEKTDTSCLKYNKKYGIKMSSSIGLRGVVDIPKKRRKKNEKYYLTPSFCKHCSCKLSEDSLGLNVDRLLFDVAEVFSRKIRIELIHTQDQLKADNTYSMFLTSVKNRMEQEMQSYFGTIIREVLIDKKDSAYSKWR